MPIHSKRFILLCFLALLLLTPLLGCRSVGEFYVRPIHASYQINRYCYQKSSKEVHGAIQWLLKRYRFPVKVSDPKKGFYQTKRTYIKKYYEHNPELAHLFTMDIRVKTHTGKVPLNGLPTWAFKANREPPKAPLRKNFPNDDAYYKAQDAYYKKITRLGEVQEKATGIMRKWIGCDVVKSTSRTVVEVILDVRTIPMGSFGQVDFKAAGKKIRSRKSLEHSVLLMIGWKLGVYKRMPKLIYRRRRRR